VKNWSDFSESRETVCKFVAGDRIRILLADMLRQALFVFFITARMLLPCGPGEPDPLRIFRPLQLRQAFLPPAKQNEPYYQELDRWSGSCLPEEYDSRAANVLLWQKSLKTRATTTDLQQLIYETPVTAIDLALLGRGGLPLLKEMALADRPALEYLRFAKSLEKHVRGNPDPWQPEPAKAEAQVVAPLIQEALERKKTAERSLALRYLYQAIRLLHYSGQYKRVETMRAHLPADFSARDPLFAQIQHLLAGALLQQQKTTEGLVALAELVAADPLAMGRVRTDFQLYQGQGNAFKNALASAAPQTGLQLHLLHFFTNPAPGLIALKEAAARRPRDPLLDFMLLREIDRLEARLEEHLFYSARVRKDPESLFQRFLARLRSVFAGTLLAAASPEELRYMRDLEGFISASVDAKVAPSPDLWLLSRVFLAYLAGDPARSLRLLSDPVIAGSNNDFVRKQSRRLQLLARIDGAREVSEDLRKEIIANYQAFAPDSKSEICPLNDNGGRIRLHRSLTALHKKQEETGLALLWETQAADIDRSAPVNTYPLSALRQALTVLETDTTPYAQLVGKLSGLKSTTLRHRLGARLLKAGDARAAMATLAPLETAVLDGIYRSDSIKAGPFANPHSEGFASGESPRSWNTLKIAQHRVELEEAIKSGQNTATAHYRLGLLEYNLSQAGNWWSAVDTDWSSYYEYSDRPGDPQFLRAMEHFRQALAQRPEKELEAAIRYMLALVSYLDETPTGWQAEDRGLKLTLVQKEQFAQLQALENTRFFREVVRDCSYFRKYRK